MARRVVALHRENSAPFRPAEVPHVRNLPLWFCLLVSFSISSLFPGSIEAQVAAGGPADPVIELGDAIIFPGEDFAWVPVLITSEDEIISWQMGLEYDELVLAFDGIDFTGTVSENLNPIPITSPNIPPYFGIQVIYAGGEGLPPGTAVLAAYLRMSLIDSDLIPTGGSVGSGVGGVSNEASPLLLTSVLGNTIVPTVIPGTITAYDFPLYLIESRHGTVLDTTVSLPIRAWTDGPVTTFTMGLEYDEWIVCELRIEGSDFDDATQGEWTLIEEPTPTGSLITLTSTGGPLPSLSGDILGELIIARPESAPGSWNFQLTEGQSFVDQTAVENLIDATATWLDHFIRGDANIDGTIDISDAEVIIAGGWLGVPFPCQDAADANDDGTLDISDVITVLQHLFSGTAPPPAPFPEPGEDPTDDDLDCL
ncbi:MAG: dockerin type I repeat-containing protein [Planctomycetota bacterium]|nr:dockerin type I repeat-containing protein [Planctomycetota bacterium]